MNLPIIDALPAIAEMVGFISTAPGGARRGSTNKAHSALFTELLTANNSGGVVNAYNADSVLFESYSY